MYIIWSDRDQIPVGYHPTGYHPMSCCDTTITSAIKSYACRARDLVVVKGNTVGHHHNSSQWVMWCVVRFITQTMPTNQTRAKNIMLSGVCRMVFPR